MAFIGRIRKRVGLLIIVIGVSLLLFILGDVVSSNSGLIGGTSDVVGVVSGEEIRYQEFEKKVEKLIEIYKINSKTENIDQSTTDMLREQAWSTEVSNNTLAIEYYKLGIACGPAELFDYITGRNPHAQIRQAFTDPNTGVYDPQNVIRFLKDLPNRDELTQKQWSDFEVALREERIAQKYKDVIKGALFATELEAKNHYQENSRIANLKLVTLNYNTIPDSAAKFEESDLKKYYNTHQNKYRQTETIRKIEYIAFDILPSAEDRQEVVSWITQKHEEFIEATDNALFVNQNSDVIFDSSYHAIGTLSPMIDADFYNAEIGTMIGPYEDDGSLKISKLTNFKMVADSVKARHILIKFVNNDTAATMHLADSLKNAIKKGSKFAELASKHSEDAGSAIMGGDLGWFTSGKMVPSFNDACFDGKKGDLTIVKSEFGVHLIEIQDKGTTSKHIQVANVIRKVEPSQKTYDALYNKANQFAAANNTGELFDSACIKQGINKRVADNLKESEKNIPGLDQPRELVRWAYKAKIGEVSKAFTIGDKYVIAHLTAIKEKGILPLEDVKQQVTAGVIKEKKGDLLIEKINNVTTGVTSIDAAAQKLSLTATDADNVNFANGYIPSIGNELRLIGTAFTLKEGQLSKPIRGENGVFLVSVKSYTEQGPTKDLWSNRRQLTEQRKGRSEFEVFNALKEKANIEDNRGKFY